ncbi:MAG: hypothetical protein LUE98_16925 [Tannerellaceae bacterium]|nr:hypothetical protein [Tannerellaceae bacterium]
MKKTKEQIQDIDPDLKITTNILFRNINDIFQIDDEKLTIIHHKNWVYRGILIAYHGFMIWINILVLYYTPSIKNIWSILDLLFWSTLLVITIIFLSMILYPKTMFLFLIV